MYLRHILSVLVLCAFLPSGVLARTAMETNQLVDDFGLPIGTAANPLFVSGGGSGGGSVMQGPAATDTAANRWPVLAYQGGTWNFGLTGPIPAGSNVIGTVNAAQNGIWTVGLSNGAAVLADLRVGGAANASGNPVFAQITNSPSVQALGAYNNAQMTVGANSFTPLGLDVRGHVKTSEAGSSDPNVGISPVTTQAGTSAVGKASTGNLYSAYAINTTTTAGYLVCINAAAAPAASAAITPVDVAYLAGSAGAQASVNYGAGPPNVYTAGITCLITTSLTTYTAGGTAFMQVRVR